jgi:hypothetical protein
MTDFRYSFLVFFRCLDTSLQIFANPGFRILSRDHLSCIIFDKRRDYQSMHESKPLNICSVNLDPPADQDSMSGLQR